MARVTFGVIMQIQLLNMRRSDAFKVTKIVKTITQKKFNPFFLIDAKFLLAKHRALRYAQQRESFGQPIWQHQSVGNYLADMATKLEAARQLVLYAARRYDSGARADLKAGMAKLFASETAMEIALNAVRIHGGYGYSTEFDVERYFRDAPLMIVGEGTNEIQRSVITRQLIARNRV